MTNHIAEAIHNEICGSTAFDTDTSSCAADALCLDAFAAVGEALKGWHVGEWPVDGQNVPLLHSDCCDEPDEYVELVNEETVGSLLRTITEHECEGER
jgi:hypothetical protein